MPSPIRRLFLGIGMFVALSSANGLAQAPADPHRSVPKLAPVADEHAQVEQQAQPPLRVPEADVVVEVVAEGPLRAQVTNVTRLFGRRQIASSGHNNYLPTILELIMLVEPNPEKPRGRPWKSVTVLTIGFDDATKQMSVEYCVDQCALNKRTRAPHPRRKMILYHAPEEHVMARLNKRVGELQPFAEHPSGRP